MDRRGTVVVAGAGGFLGGHLVADLRRSGVARIRAVDIRPVADWQQAFDDVENQVLDLRQAESCSAACRGAQTVFNLAANMGGMGFIEANKAACMLNVLISTHMLVAARDNGIERFFYSSSACVYSAEKQASTDVEPLREEDAYPAMPEDGYGWEKLFSERMCRHFYEDYGLETRVARLHNVYGPFGTWEGGREKAPAALSRKVIEAKLSGRHEIEIWGDGEQTRSFTFIDDWLVGMHLIMDSEVHTPLNLGSSEQVSINQLVDILEEIAGLRLERKYLQDAPLGVRGRSSDNTRVEQLLGWSPETSLRTGMARTYEWILGEYLRRNTRPRPE